MTAPTAEPVTWTSREAAELLGVSPVTVRRMCRTGRFDGVRVGHEWLIDGQEATRTSHVPPGRLPRDPLLRRIEFRGGAAACGVTQHSAEEKALERARQARWLTVWAADLLSVRLLGLAPCELWGDARPAGRLSCVHGSPHRTRRPRPCAAGLGAPINP